LQVFRRSGRVVAFVPRRASASRKACSSKAVSVLPDSAACFLAAVSRSESRRTVVRICQGVFVQHQYVKLGDSGVIP
jgi:hypothetical protein